MALWGTVSIFMPSPLACVRQCELKAKLPEFLFLFGTLWRQVYFVLVLNQVERRGQWFSLHIPKPEAAGGTDLPGSS